MADDDDILNIELEDLDDLSDEELYPPIAPGVTPEEALGLADPPVQVACACTATGRPFSVRFQEVQPGVFQAGTVTAQEGPARAPAGPAAQSQVQGRFGLERYAGCPYCGSRALVLCDRCGVAMCGGQTKKRLLGGMTLTCPACGSRGTLTGQAQSVPASGGKGKKMM